MRSRALQNRHDLDRSRLATAFYRKNRAALYSFPAYEQRLPYNILAWP